MSPREQSKATYRIYVSLPAAYESSQDGFPVVYLLDGDWYFGLAASTSRLLEATGEERAAVLVAIGYGGTVEDQRRRRAREFTPAPEATLADSGHAAEFLAALRQDIIPAIESRYRTTSERVLLGHSLGGLFAAYAITRAPGLFRHVVIGSPAFWSPVTEDPDAHCQGLGAAFFALALLASGASAGTLLTSNTIDNPTTIDFSLLTPNTLMDMAVLPGGITLTPVSDVQFYVIGNYGLGSNGAWASGAGAAVGVGTAFGIGPFLRFAFPSPVAAVGGFVSYCVDLPGTCGGGDTPIMRVLDASFNVLDEFDIALAAPISTPAGSLNDGAFRGIDMGGNVISYFEWGGMFVTQRDLTYGISAAIPEPAMLFHFATGVAGLGAARRWRARKV